MKVCSTLLTVTALSSVLAVTGAASPPAAAPTARPSAVHSAQIELTQFSSIIGIFIGDGTAEHPDAGLLIGDGYSYIPGVDDLPGRVCADGKACDGGRGGFLLGNGGTGSTAVTAATAVPSETAVMAARG